MGDSQLQPAEPRSVPPSNAGEEALTLQASSRQLTQQAQALRLEAQGLVQHCRLLRVRRLTPATRPPEAEDRGESRELPRLVAEARAHCERSRRLCDESEVLIARARGTV